MIACGRRRVDVRFRRTCTPDTGSTVRGLTVADRLAEGWPVWRIAEMHGITVDQVRALIIESVSDGSAHGAVFGSEEQNGREPGLLVE